MPSTSNAIRQAVVFIVLFIRYQIVAVNSAAIKDGGLAYHAVDRGTEQASASGWKQRAEFKKSAGSASRGHLRWRAQLGTEAGAEVTKKDDRGFLARHSLSLVSAAILILWIVLYLVSDEHTHLGAFYGNAIADWSGLLVTVLATKVMYEIGSAESKKPPRHFPERLWDLVQEHSLTIFLVVTGVGWAILYWRMNPDAKWGQVVGNIAVSYTHLTLPTIYSV